GPPLGRGERLVILNPILDPSRNSRRQQLVVSGARRAAHVLFFSRGGARDGLELGVRGEFVPLGVRARRDDAAPPGDHLLAVGRDHRDWATLARAAQALDIEVRVIGPASVPGPLRLVDPVARRELFGLMEQAAAVVVPLMDDRRTAGQLAVLDAFAVGRGVVATRGPGTEDYVTDDTGFLVPPGEADALRAALGLAADPSVAASLGEAALAAVRGPLSLTTFVSTVDAAARSLSSVPPTGDARCGGSVETAFGAMGRLALLVPLALAVASCARTDSMAAIRNHATTRICSGCADHAGDLGRYGYVTLHAWDRGRIPKIRAENPKAKILVYK